MRHLPYTVLGAAFGSLLSIGSLASPTEKPTIYECKDPSGNVVYQDDPCPEDTSRKAAAPAASKPDGSRTGRHAPATVLPAPTSGRSARPREWRVIEPARGGRVLAGAGAALPSSSGPFASPESTWRAFAAAVGSGDRAAAAACLTSSALASLGARAETLAIEKLRETVSSCTRLVVDGEVGPFWSVHALRPGMRPKWIFFERNARGEWKIAGI